MTSPINIVRLDGIHLPSPTFSPDLKHTYTEYPLTSAHEIPLRLKEANVAITTTIPISRATLLSCPNLKLVCAMAIGTDHIDLAACAELGVTVCNVPAASNECVAEHAISFYFALRRRTVRFHELAREGTDWKGKGSLKGVFGKEFPGTAREEVMGIVGAGELGRRVANIGKALGMTVVFLERKDASLSDVRPDRVSFQDGLRQSTILMITCPRTPSTMNLISTPELALMRSNAILINVARGGIVDEEALVDALKEEKIMGAAADVFVEEPATKENSPLVRAAGEEWAWDRLVLSPHVAWCAQSSNQKLRGTVTQNVEAWTRGQPLNLVV